MTTSLNVAAAQWRRLTWALGLLLALAAQPALGQVLPTNPNGTDLNPAVPMVRPDTATVRKPTKKQKREQAAADSARRTERLFGFRLTKPAKAGLLAIVPGGGQIYNHKYWKLPLVYGMVGGLGYWISYQARYFTYYNYAYYHTPAEIRAASDEIPNDELREQLAAVKTSNPNSIDNARIGARRYLDLSILLSSAGYALTILDAVVDAHLSEFDVSDNLSLRWQPTAVPVPGQAAFAPGVVLSLRTRQKIKN